MKTPPTMMGPYEVLEAVGKGGMGTVYRARKPQSSQDVAIKVMETEAASYPVLVKRFEQEFVAASRLCHPHLVRALDFGLQDGRPYLVMEFVEGQNLTEYIVRRGRIPQEEAVRIILQVADGLGWAHQNHLIHRDVKSDNVLLTRDGQAKLTDLGLCKDLEGASGLTRTQTCLGTVAFVAPEQYEDAKRADVRSDIYGLGATLYHSLTGVVPFQGRRNLLVLRKKLQTDFVPAGRLVPGLPQRIDDVIRKALDASPALRQGSCQEFIEALADVCGKSAADSLERPAESGDEERVEPDSNPSDRRRATRYPARIGTSCRPVHEARRRWNAEVQDISATGVRLRLGRRFEAGAVLAVEILDERSRPASTLYAKVLWVQEVASKKWEVGCAFNTPLDASELDTYLNKPRTIVIYRD